MRSRLAAVLALLAAVALVGALVQRSGKGSADANTTTPTSTRPKPKPNPNRVVVPRGPLPGALLIADRGNNRILLVDPHRHTLWSFPTAHDRALGRRLVFDDDTFVEPGGNALVTNEEDHGDILSIDIATHRVTRLYGRPGVNGSGPGEMNWP